MEHASASEMLHLAEVLDVIAKMQHDRRSISVATIKPMLEGFQVPEGILQLAIQLTAATHASWSQSPIEAAPTSLPSLEQDESTIDNLENDQEEEEEEEEMQDDLEEELGEVAPLTPVVVKRDQSTATELRRTRNVHTQTFGVKLQKSPGVSVPGSPSRQRRASSASVLTRYPADVHSESFSPTKTEPSPGSKSEKEREKEKHVEGDGSDHHHHHHHQGKGTERRYRVLDANGAEMILNRTEFEEFSKSPKLVQIRQARRLQIDALVPLTGMAGFKRATLDHSQEKNAKEKEREKDVGKEGKKVESKTNSAGEYSRPIKTELVVSTQDLQPLAGKDVASRLQELHQLTEEVSKWRHEYEEQHGNNNHPKKT